MAGGASDRRLLLASITLVAGMVAISLILANLRYFELGEGGEPLGPEAYQVAELLAYTLVPIWAILALWLVLSPRRKRGVPGKAAPRRGGMAGYVLMLVVIGAIIAFAALTNGQMVQQPEGQPNNGQGGEGDDAQPLMRPDGAGGTMLILAFLVVIAALALGGWVRVVRQRPVRMSRAVSALETRRAKAIVDRAVEELVSGEDARSVIVRAYQRMSRLVGGRLPQARYLTPRELATEAETRFHWPGGATDQLTSLFEEAWYSDHAMSEQQKERALRCLREISAATGAGGEGQDHEAVASAR